jgi:hypothetical protein
VRGFNLLNVICGKVATLRRDEFFILQRERSEGKMVVAYINHLTVDTKLVIDRIILDNKDARAFSDISAVRKMVKKH